MENLFLLRKNNLVMRKEKCSILNRQRIDQKYYTFLTLNLMNYLQGMLEDYCTDLNNLKGKVFYASVDNDICNLIEAFILDYGLGSVERFVDNKRSFLTITFGSVSIDYVISSFYEELQRLEYRQKSKEEMWRDLKRFKENNADWIMEKQNNGSYSDDLASVILDNELDLYDEFLNSFRESGSSEFMRFKCESFAVRELIQDFLDFYNLGTYYYTAVICEMIFIRFQASEKEKMDAFMMESQRMLYYKNAVRSRRK